MYFPDIFRLNDFKIKWFFLTVISILIIYDCSILIDRFLFKIPIVPQLLGFVILTFIPGFIILKLLKIHQIDRVTNILLVSGLSLFFITFIIFLFDLIFVAFFDKSSLPISFSKLVILTNISILLTLFVSCYIDRSYVSDEQSLFINVPSKIMLFFLLPFLSIFGAYLMTFYNLNVFIIILLFLISLLPFIILFGSISERYYPIIIFITSISVLYHINLISLYLLSWDIFVESYISNLVIKQGVWLPDLPYNLNSLLLFSLLVPAYSLLCNLGFIWVLKLIFPFIFGLTPVILYKIYQELYMDEFKFGNKMAYLSSLLFIYFYGFFKDMPDKQHISEFFISLILLATLIKNQRISLMIILFSFLLITSHYGVSYLFLISLFVGTIIYRLSRFENAKILRLNFLLFFSVLVLAWYIFIASGTQFEAIAMVINHVVNQLSDVFTPESRSGAAYAIKGMPTISWQIYKFVQIVLQIFIALGGCKLIFLIIKMKIKNFEIAIISIIFYAFLIIQISVTCGLGFDRIFQITTILLSPLALIGFNILFNFLNKNNARFGSNSSLMFFSLFLCIFFLFNSGLAFELVGDPLPTYSIAINKSAGWPLYDEEEVQGVLWLIDKKIRSPIAASFHELLLLSTYYEYKKELAPIRSAMLPSKTFIYLSNSNVINRNRETLNFSSVIYNNNHSKIYMLEKSAHWVPYPS